MTNKSTKRALISSVFALVLCFAMLLGTTFAWFTDTATSTGNKIVSGNLDVQLKKWTSATASEEITDESAPLFAGDDIWEPGKTRTVYLSIKNAGTLALKYRVALEVAVLSARDLTEVMEYDVISGAKYGEVTSWANEGTTVVPGTNATDAEDVVLQPGDERFFALSIHMKETANDHYQGDSISFDIKVLAGQLASEFDSFGNTYDKFASYPGKGFADATGATAAEILITGEDGYKVGSVVIPKEAGADGISQYTAVIENSNYKGNFTVSAGHTATVYNVEVEGIKDGNTVPVKVQLKIATGLDPDTVKLYHYDSEIDCVYNPSTGYVTFETATFSPFSIVYDPNSVYVAPSVPDGENKRPTAKVTYASEYVNDENLDWGSYGQWSPTEGLDSVLEAAFVFECPTDLDEDVRAAFENWYCDFYVSLDRELGENQIFLGGNYGSFGWVGFHNGDLTLPANEEIPLLGSVTSNPWTYADVEFNVGTFICGVGDVDDALDGATFTVKLRLTNPENEAEFYDVNVVTYTFGGNYSIK